MKIYKLAALSDEARQKLTNPYHQIIDQKNISGYDIVLVRVVPLNMYQIGFQQENLDFTDVPSQMQKIKPENQVGGVKKLLEDLKTAIDEWRNLYGRLYVVSTNEAKQDKFKRILIKMGYVISEDVVMGKRVFYI
jgi:hypothetical protein